jgi:hypothetical protein
MPIGVNNRLKTFVFLVYSRVSIPLASPLPWGTKEKTLVPPLGSGGARAIESVIARQLSLTTFAAQVDTNVSCRIPYSSNPLALSASNTTDDLDAQQHGKLLCRYLFNGRRQDCL